MYRMVAGVSGGTIASMLSMIEDIPFAKLRAAIRPYANSPVKGVHNPGGSFIYTFPKVPGRKAAYGAIFPLAPQNVATVQRTWGLLQLYKVKAIGQAQTSDDAVIPLPYGDDFTYGESMQAPSLFEAALLSFTIATALLGLLLFSTMRWLLRKVTPKPGDGPSDKYVRLSFSYFPILLFPGSALYLDSDRLISFRAMERGFLEGRNITESTPSPETGKPIFVETTISGVGDPGYTLTASSSPVFQSS